VTVEWNFFYILVDLRRRSFRIYGPLTAVVESIEATVRQWESDDPSMRQFVRNRHSAGQGIEAARAWIRHRNPTFTEDPDSDSFPDL
jgi:hypothetical protein